jgi:putative ABC transport system substrate-binding protein
MMDRRVFLGAVAGGLLVAPRAAEAQQPGKVHQIGHLILGTPAESANRIKALRAGLRDHGCIEGKNIAFVFRSADTADPLPELAAELVRLKVDLIFAPSSTEVEAARQATALLQRADQVID